MFKKKFQNGSDKIIESKPVSLKQRNNSESGGMLTTLYRLTYITDWGREVNEASDTHFPPVLVQY